MRKKTVYYLYLSILVNDLTRNKTILINYDHRNQKNYWKYQKTMHIGLSEIFTTALNRNEIKPIW